MEMQVLEELRLRCCWSPRKGPEPEVRAERREGTSRHLSTWPDTGGRGMPYALFPRSGWGCRISWRSWTGSSTNGMLGFISPFLQEKSHVDNMRLQGHRSDLE